jgi:ribokinase
VQACCCSVPRLPMPGETLVATGVHIEPGGKGLNVAVCLQRLGLHVDCLIGCGNDAAGNELLALLQREGVETRHVHQLPSASGWGSGWIAADGQNAIAVYPGANLLLTEAHIVQAALDIAQAQLVYGQFETALPAVEAAFAVAYDKGITTVLNPSPWQTPPMALQRTTHTVIVNETEAMGLLAMTNVLEGSALACALQITSSLTKFWQQWPSVQRLIVTLGAGGSLGFEKSEISQCWHVAAPTVTAIDTVGAGDAFASGYCAATVAGHDLTTALRWGNTCGAYLASKAGVLAALPTEALLHELLEQTSLIQPLSQQLSF